MKLKSLDEQQVKAINLMKKSESVREMIQRFKKGRSTCVSQERFYEKDAERAEELELTFDNKSGSNI